MKGKKAVMAVVAVTMCVSSAAMFTACEGKNVHTHTFVYETTTQPTCTTPGEETGKCKTCDATDKRALPVVSDAHTYGDWDITKPTETGKGSAQKVCGENREHKIEVELPAYEDEDEYDSVQKDMEGVLTDGSYKYTLKHQAGDIVFDRFVPARGITTVGDAIELGSSNHDLVKSGLAYVGKTGSGATNSEIRWEYGDNYVYTKDTSMFEEHFLSIDRNGEILSVRRYLSGNLNGKNEGDLDIDNNIDSDNMDDYMTGFRFNMTWSFGGRAYFGVENLLAGLYEWAQSSDTQDFAESIDKTGETPVYTFSYGYYNATYQYFIPTTVSFTLDERYVVNSASVETKIYTKASGAYTLDTETGKCTLINPDNYNYNEFIRVEEQVAYAEGEASVENEYSEDKIFVKSIEVKDSSGNVLQDGDTMSMAVDTPTYYSFNVSPETSSVLDPVKFYAESEDGTREECAAWGTEIRALIMMDGRLLVRSDYPGEHTFLMVSRNIEMRFTLNVTWKTPNPLYPVTYKYSEGSDSYMAIKASSNKATATVFINQPLYITSAVDNVQMEDARFTAVANPADSANMSAFDFKPSQDMQDAVNPLFVFTASKPGVYTVTMTSETGKVTSTVTITVKEPDLSDVLVKSSYENKVENVQVKLTPSEEALPEGVEYAGNVEITDSLGVAVYSYSYADGALTTEFVSGAETQRWRLDFNQAYSLVITKTDAFGDKTIALLTKVKEAGALALTGTYKNGMRAIVFNEDDKTGTIWNSSMDIEILTFSYTYQADTSDKTKYVLTFTEVTNISGMAGIMFSKDTANSGSYAIVSDGAFASVTVLFTNDGGGSQKMDVVKPVSIAGLTFAGDYKVVFNEDGETAQFCLGSGVALVNFHYTLTETDTAGKYKLTASDTEVLNQMFANMLWDESGFNGGSYATMTDGEFTSVTFRLKNSSGGSGYVTPTFKVVTE